MRSGIPSSDEQIIAKIRQCDEHVLAELYERNYPAIAHHIIKNNGSETEAQDVFQDTIVIFWEKVVQSRLSLTSTLGTYLFSIAKNLWLKELRRKKNLFQTELGNDEQGMEPDQFTQDYERELNKRQQIAEECMAKSTETCKSIIQYFYFDRLSMKEIALKMVLKNEDVAKNMKSKCMRKLEECVKQNG